MRAKTVLITAKIGNANRLTEIWGEFTIATPSEVATPYKKMTVVTNIIAGKPHSKFCVYIGKLAILNTENVEKAKDKYDLITPEYASTINSQIGVSEIPNDADKLSVEGKEESSSHKPLVLSETTEHKETVLEEERTPIDTV